MKRKETKRCSKCKEYKGRSAFYVDAQTKDGLHGHCKACHRRYELRKSSKFAGRPKRREADDLRAELDLARDFKEVWENLN